jgi:RNA polymerase sigma-70 factor (ECF subfamily)
MEEAEGRYHLEPADRLSPEALYDRRWAIQVVDRARQELSSEYEATGRARLLAPLLAGHMGEPGAASYSEVARSLGMTEAAVKKAAQRLRKRLGELIRQQIAATVAGPEQVEEEVRALFEALKR